MASSKQIRLNIAALREPAGAGIYLRTLLGLLAACLVFSVILLNYAQRHGDLPPAPLTSELFFNEKAQFVRDHRGQIFDIMIAGSSLSVNDLSSDAFLEEIPNHPSMINIAVFGTRISETRLWLNHVIRSFGKPKLVVICLSPLDFQPEKGWYAPADRFLDGYLGGRFQPALYFENFSLLNFTDLMRHIKEDRTTRRWYSSLDFDSDGGVPLDMNYPKVELDRWNYVPRYDQIEERQYNELNRLAADLKSSGISLVCVLAPTRRADRTRENTLLADKYESRVTEILEKNGQTLLDLDSTLDLDDSHFADYIHLNARGAQAFSQVLGRDLASMPAFTASSVVPRRLEEAH